MNRFLVCVVILGLGLSVSGCLLGKVVAAPLRITGAVVSVVPVVGSPIDAALDTGADVLD